MVAPKNSPEEVEGTFRILDDLYLLGSLEKGVTIYSQQIRAHNLAWALWEQSRKGRPLGDIAIVGGGIAGMTLAACLLALDATVKITLFEKSWDLCPIQQGADVRWVHPRIYDWPFEGSRAPSASLPVLDWSEGRASDVARTILRDFSRYATTFAASSCRLKVYLGLRNFQITAASRKISWVGHVALLTEEYFELGRSEGDEHHFDKIILTTGFGTEVHIEGYKKDSYWRNEQLGQPPFDGSERRFMVSGFGDGALVDLCRLTIERFRQDTISYELFGKDLEKTERHFADQIRTLGPDHNFFAVFKQHEEIWLDAPKRRLASRIRKDTRLTLHLSGRNKEIESFAQIFGRRSSFLHRLIVYLLYRCGAFDLEFSDLSEAAERRGVSTENVLCRYGADTIEHTKRLFSDAGSVETRLSEIKDKQAQQPLRYWVPGTFPHF
jgi:hypothetical protein